MSLFIKSKISKSESNYRNKLKEAFRRARGRPKQKMGQIPKLPYHGKDLGLFSQPGRIRWAKAFCKVIERHFGCVDQMPVTRKLYHFTLVSIDAAVAHTLTDVDVEPLKTALCRELAGVNFVGMLEPALYSHISVPDGSNRLKTCVSWHLHLLVWDISPRTKKEFIRGLNKSDHYVPLVPGQVGVKSRKIYNLPKMIRYILKPLASVYRIGQKRTGQKVRYQQFRSNNPRPGELVTLYLHAQHLSCDQLAVAGGEGRKLLDQILEHIAPSSSRRSFKRTGASHG